MDLGFSEEQVMLRNMVKRLCDELAPLSKLREMEGREPGFCRQFWRQLGELGLTGLMIPESFGGLGLGALEAVVIGEEFGRNLAVSPFNNSAILGASLIVSAGTADQKKSLLPRLSSGGAIVTVASDEYGGGSGPESVLTTATLCGDHYVLSGEKHYVPFAANADFLIVLARLAGAENVVIALCVERSTLSSDQITYLPNHAREPLYKVSFDNLQVPARSVLKEGQSVWSDWESAMSGALIFTAACAVGAAEQVQSITVDYARYRHAFGRPIGGFQAIAHYLADVEVMVQGVRTLTHQAAWARDNEKPFQPLAAMAKLQACDVFCRAAAVAIQVHGGIGYTLEADPQLYFRRARHLQEMFWGPEYLEQRIAGFVL